MDQEINQPFTAPLKPLASVGTLLSGSDFISIELLNEILKTKSENEFLSLLAAYAQDLYPEHLRVTIFKYEPQSKTLKMAASPSLPYDLIHQDFSIPVGAETSPSGRAVHYKKPVFSGNILEDHGWSPYLNIALGLSVKSCWAFPILSSSKEVLGTFTFYFDKVLTATPSLPPLLEGLTNLAGVGMEKWSHTIQQDKILAELKSYKDRLTLALSAQHMGVWDLDLRNKEAVWDDVMFDLYGIEKNTGIYPRIHTDDWENAIHPEDRERSARAFFAAAEKGHLYDHSYRIVKKTNGQIRYINSVAHFRYYHGKPVRVLGFNWDITDRVQAQKKIDEERTKAVASSKMAALGEMAINIAHEINNPLTIILNHASLLKDRLEQGKTDLAKDIEELNRIEQTVGRISRIIRGLSAFSRNSDNDPLIECDVQSIVEDSFELCRERFIKSGIEIRLFDIPQNTFINCRPAQISQVIINLLNNSFDAIQELNEKWVGVHVKKIGSLLELSVIDSGHGIPEIVAEKIMDPFFTTKEIGRGTGLGLSISKGIIEEHGGKLFYDKNHPNTRFVMVLPVV